MSIRSRVSEFVYGSAPYTHEKLETLAARNRFGANCLLGLAGSALLGAGIVFNLDNPALTESIQNTLAVASVLSGAVGVASGVEAAVLHHEAMQPQLAPVEA